MAGEDDIAARLPEPPPPAPARRRAAIDEAMRRFDVAHGGMPVAGPPGFPSAAEQRRRRIGRPQAAALVTAGLAALFGVPAAWLLVSQRGVPGDRAHYASVERTMPAGQVIRPNVVPTLAASSRAMPASPSPAKEGASSQAPGEGASNGKPATGVVAPTRDYAMAAPLPPPPLAVQAEQIARADADVSRQLASASAPPPSATTTANTAVQSHANPQTAVEEPMKALAPRDDVIVTSQRRAENLITVPLTVTAASTAARKPGWRAGKVTPSPTTPPPAGATASTTMDAETAAMRRAQGFGVSGDIVVTGLRRQGPGRGDWNACTLDDPKRSLEACRHQINPAAHGLAGQAAAQLAEGLRRGWEGDDEGAISAFEQAIALAPHSAAGYLNRGLAYQRQGDLDRAKADFDKAVRLAPGQARGYYLRSRLLRERGDEKGADADEDRAVAMDPDYQAAIR